MRGRITALAAALARAAGCGTTGTFVLSADDNNPAALARAFEAERRPEAGKPINGTGRPLAFLVTTGAQNKLVAWDLAEGKALWTVDGPIGSRVAVGRDVLAHVGAQGTLIARDVRDGRILWTHAIPGAATFFGVAADEDRVYYVVRHDGAKPRWSLVALRGGSELWREEASGPLGAPAARGGLVYTLFMSQWLTILDGTSGRPLARIRQTDEPLRYVRATTDGVYFGSQGIFRLDERAVSGDRAGASYLAPELHESVRTTWHFGAYEAAQAGYTAVDRNRILWRGAGEGDGFGFLDDTLVVFTFRFFFAFDVAAGTLRWAHQHPRFDVIAAEHLGSAIAYASQEGEVGALDPRTGARLGETKSGLRLMGATFDADGWRPAGEGAAVDSHEALVSIVWNRDARFNTQKSFAVTMLGALPGPEPTAALIKVLQEEAMPPPVVQAAATALVARKVPEGLTHLIAALETRSDFVAGTRLRAIDALARAAGAIGRPEATPALIARLHDPETPLAAIKDVVEALAACGDPAALPALRSFLLIYRADPGFGPEPAALTAAVDALLVHGGGAEREIVGFVAADPRSEPRIAEYARRALTQTEKDAGAGAR
jgi:outer membrane protein assembly factor BamB